MAEAGTHAELMALDGEYAKLYNIQASAFTSVAKDVEVSHFPLEMYKIAHLA